MQTRKETVKKYENPVKTLKIKGINSGKNLAGKFKNQYNASAAIKKNISNATVTVEAAKNWEITNVSFYTYRNKKSPSYIGSLTLNNYMEFKKKVTLRPGSLNKSQKYSVVIGCINKKTGGSLACFFTIKIIFRKTKRTRNRSFF